MSDVQRPILGLSGAEAARVLGVHELTVARLVRQGVLHKRAQRQQFAEVLGLTSGRVTQLVHEGKLPAVRSGRRRFYRRHQVEVIANARGAPLG